MNDRYGYEISGLLRTPSFSAGPSGAGAWATESAAKAAKEGRFNAAWRDCQIAYQLGGDSFQLRFITAAILNDGGKPADARQVLQETLQWRLSAPQRAEALHGLALAALGLLQIDLAAELNSQCLTIQPGYRPGLVARAHLQLLRGDLVGGFRDYENRAWRPKLIRPWDGIQLLTGATVIVRGEQGFGDEIQFARFVPALREKGCRVVLKVRDQLADTLGRTLGLPVLSREAPDPNFDYDVALMSLPWLLKTSIDRIPPPLRVTSSAAELPAEGALRVGVAWGCSGNHHDSRRLPAEKLIDALDLPDAQLCSLQRGPDADALRGDPRLIDLEGDEIGNVARTAAHIASLDVIVTSDTFVGHLAGALGKPVWVLLPVLPCWRWMLNRRDSPWYPGMRLFRQQRHGNWESVFREVREALVDEIQSAVTASISKPPRIRST